MLFNIGPVYSLHNAYDACAYFSDDVVHDDRENSRQKCHSALRDVCLSKDLLQAKKLLSELGSDAELIVNLAPNGSNTLLFLCCESCEKEFVKLLLEYGADGRIHPVTKYSPLYIACYNGHREIAQMILDKFPELVRQWTVEKWLPIHAACIGGHVNVMELLLNYNYPHHVLIKFSDEKNEWEHEMPFDVNMKDASGQTVLYLACLLGNVKMIDVLLKFKVRGVKIKNSKDVSPEQCNEEQVLSPTRKRISDGIQSIMSRLNLKSRPEGSNNKETERAINPIHSDLYCSEAQETALHVAVRQKHNEIAAVLLAAGANPNLVALRSNVTRNHLDDDTCYSCLVDACYNRDVTMVDMLLKYSARDDQCKALKLTTSNKDDLLTAKLLSIKAHPDPEYKLNKKAMTEQLPRGSLAGLASLTYSSVFPNTPAMINWHGNKCQLNYIKHNWLIDAAIHVNPKLKLNPRNQEVVLYAITRLDVSHNSLSELPAIVFQLPSLRYLNLSQNKIEKLPEWEEKQNSLTKKNDKYNIPVLEEFLCQNNRLESIPVELFSLPSLVTLDLSNNKLQELPQNLWQAPSLKELNLAFNLLKELPACVPEVQKDGSVPESPVNTDVNLLDESGVECSPLHSKTVQSRELKHQNIWCSSVELTEQIVTDRKYENCSQITSLNLAHNLFTSVPPMLACLAVNLTRLNISSNKLRSMSHITTYPSSLKQLDLSYNGITCWPSLPQVDTLDCHIMCYKQQQQQDKNNSKLQKLAGRQSGVGLRNIVLHSLCSHRRHVKLDNLRTLIVGDNCLEKIQLGTDEDTGEEEENEWQDLLHNSVNSNKTKLLFPNLSMLDISNNKLKEIPHNIHDLSNLSVLNISGNSEITELTPQMGLLTRLWNLNTNGCNLQEPLKSMIESKKYKTMDVVGYLKSVLEDARPYARMKLMLVGIQGIGKTSLLEQLRQEGPSYRKKPHEHWAKRMGNKHINVKTSRGSNMSTVGVDIGLWVFEKKSRNSGSKGPVIFRTWDFGGQREYYATHQYFLSKRSLYLVVWKITDGQRGIRDIRQWLVNIQARAPNSPVLIVGTHYDEMAERNLLSRSEDLQQVIRDRFINIVDGEKCGLPKVLDTIEVSCKTRHNIKLLCSIIYDTVFSLRPPGSKELLLEQRVPACYLALEDVVYHLASERRASGIDPVLNSEQYKTVVSSEMQYRYHKTFRDWSELHQATLFLHDNGVLLHYEDSTLRDLYFLDPQWLCDMLAHVVTIREINPFARTGVMKLSDLKHVFKSSHVGTIDTRGYIVNLLNKFEVALTWDNCTLLIPSLLPSEEDMQAPFATSVRVKIPVRSRGWAVRSKKLAVSASSNTLYTTKGDRVQLTFPLNITSPSVEEPPVETPTNEFQVLCKTDPEKSIRRLLLMNYFPSGFWSRLITRLLADDAIIEIVRGFFPMPKEMKKDAKLAQWLDIRTDWVLWQTGMELKYGSVTLFKMKEILVGSKLNIMEYHHMTFRLQQDGVWTDMDLTNTSILEIFFPVETVIIKRSVDSEQEHTIVLEPNIENTAKLLALAVDHIDILLEDWYPTLGTRFVHTSEGKFLVTRLIPCPKCLSENCAREAGEDETHETWEENGDGEAVRRIRQSQDSVTSDCDSGVGAESNGSSRFPSVEGHPDMSADDQLRSDQSYVYSWIVEECILAASECKNVRCPVHAEIYLSAIAPDTVFMDLGERHLIRSENITRGPLLGRGAFGFVFKGSCKTRGSNHMLDVAMKMLQPVQPGPNVRQSAMMAYKAAQSKWDRDPLQYACKAYCTARQELNILLTLRHSNIVPLVGVCTKPLALVLDLAPQGALDVLLRHYRRSGAKITSTCLQEVILQVAKAVEYLHQQHIIYRDLKSENVLVWSLPPPFQEPISPVHVKVADYGISRLTLPSGSKGFGGTEGFMAPEMMRYNGEEEYTEKVDCFSFGMFIYELLTLHQPFEGHESVKECILDGTRPPLTYRETLYPSCILDLMVLCWAQQPRDRPTASQIVSMASAPEFKQIRDCVSLEHTNEVYCAAVAHIVKVDEGGSNKSQLWLGGEKRVDFLVACENGWQFYGKIPFLTNITATTTVGSQVWLGDDVGNLYAYKSADCGLLWNYALGDSSVVSILNLDGFARVAVGLKNGRLFLVRNDVCPSTAAMAEGSFVMTELGSSEHLYTLAQVKQTANECELWVGENTGYISVYTIRDEIVSGHDRVNHYNPVIDKVQGVYICSGNGEGIYSRVFPGCVVYQWDTDSKEISSTLDCTKLVPCSESLKPLTIEDLSEKCQVTCVELFEGCVYVGTAWGCVIVADKSNLYPITVFRPFEQEVNIIMPLFDENIVGLAGKGYRSLAARNTDMVSSPGINSPTQQRKLSVHLLLWQHTNS